MTRAKLPPGVRVRSDGRLDRRITLEGAHVSVYALTPKELEANVERRSRLPLASERTDSAHR